LEVATAVFDKSFSEWKPAVEYSLSSIKLELTKLNSFIRDAKHQTASKAGVLQIESVSERAPSGSNADGPNGHRSDNTYRDCGFGTVFTQIHDPVKGIMCPPPPPALTILIEALTILIEA
jgi:hypothetical protein